MDAVFASVRFWLAPIIAFMVSLIYFLASPHRQPLVGRLLVSAHGIVIALLYFSAAAVGISGASGPVFDKLFASAFVVPLALIVLSLAKFQGPQLIHLLQLPNILALFWVFFIGSMAVTGSWL